MKLLRGLIAVITLGLMFVGLSSLPASAVETDTTITKLNLTRDGQPQVRVAAGSDVWISLLRADGWEQQVVQYAGNTEVYRLPAIKRGTKVTYSVSAVDVETGEQLASKRFTWKRHWRQLFTWRGIDNPSKKRTYYFYLQSRPRTQYLTAASKLRVRIQRADGSLVTRRVGLMFGDGDLVWEVKVARSAKVRWTKATATGWGAKPRQGYDVLHGGVR